MVRSHRIYAFLTFLGLASLASAQARTQLTLATVLQRGRDMAVSLPKVLWQPDGHQGGVMVTGDDGNQVMYRLQYRQIGAEPWFTAADVHAALGIENKAMPTAPRPNVKKPDSKKPDTGKAGETDTGKADAGKTATKQTTATKRTNAQNSRATKPAPKPAAKRFPRMSWHDANTLRILHDQGVWHWQVGSKQAQRVLDWHMPKHTGAAQLLEIAPNDQHAAVRSNHQLFVHDRHGEAHQLTFDGSEDVVIAGAAHRAEIGITKGTFWSKHGRFLAFYHEDQRPIARYPYQNVKAMPPTPRHGRYPMAGKTHSTVRVKICDTKTYRVVTLQADPDADVYWTNITFGPDNTVVVAVINRGQDHLELQRFDALTGKLQATLLREHDREWIEPEHPAHFLQDGRFLWMSSRDVFRHIYLHEADGARIRQITKGNFDVQTLLQVEEDESHLWFQASGDDPRQLHLFRARLNGDAGERQRSAQKQQTTRQHIAQQNATHHDVTQRRPTQQQDTQQQITQRRGTHRVSLSPDATQAYVAWSNLQTRPTAHLLDVHTGTTHKLPQPKNPFAEFDLPKQHFFEVAAKDGTNLYGHVALPPDLQPGQRAPVIHYVYGGPHAQLVKDQWFGGASTWLQALAAEGYVVCRLDNRGTPNRGIEFEQAVHRHLGTLEVEDQLRAIDWLKQQPFVDPTRIGVHGWSFGGYMTMRLMLLHPEVFACGVSGAPVTDWAMYETGYGERYMDSPAENPDGYEASSCLPLAGRLQRPLLVVQGSDDRTVMWAHTLKFVDACIGAGVDEVEYFVYPQQAHGLRGKYRLHFLRKLHGWFGRHLRPEDRGASK